MDKVRQPPIGDQRPSALQKRGQWQIWGKHLENYVLRPVVIGLRSCHGQVRTFSKTRLFLAVQIGSPIVVFVLVEDV